MVFNRRSFLLGSASAFAVLAASPALARVHRGSAQSSGFNNGKTQGQANFPPFGGDFPFANLLKGVGENWQTDNNGFPLVPSAYDANGYPSEVYLNAQGVGVQFGPIILPLQSSRPVTTGNPLVVTWTSTGPSNVSCPFTHLQTGSNTASGSGTTYTGRFEFTIDYYTDPRTSPFGVAGAGQINLQINSIAAGASINNLQMFFKADETVPGSGTIPIFGTAFLARLKQANFGVFRDLDWIATNVGGITTWATRKSVGYPTWCGEEWRAALYCGITSGTDGQNYSLTIPGGYAWTGPLGSYTTGGAPVDKMTIHIGWNVDGILQQNSTSNTAFSPGGVPSLTIISFSPLTFGWPSNPLVNDDPVTVWTTGFAMQGVNQAQSYYVVNATGSQFQISLTSGGSAISSTSTSISGDYQVTRCPALTIDGTHKIAVHNTFGEAGNSSTQLPFGTNNQPTQVYATLVYDATFNCWLMFGGSREKGSVGIDNRVPVEIFVELCKECGMHPYVSVPMLCMDNATDFVPSLAAYINSVNPGWMIPRYEPGNEVWNTATPITRIAWNKAQIYWGNQFDDSNWYGRALSMMGQQLATVYGAANLGTKYLLGCGSQYVTSFTSGGWPEPRLTAAAYVASGPVQSGFSQVSALSPTKLVSSMICANYTGAVAAGTGLQLTIPACTLSWQYAVTNAGNPTAQMANLNTYVDSMPGPGDQTNASSGIAFYHGTALWGQSHGITNMFGYEGGWSFDLLLNYDISDMWFATVTAASKATSCVVALPVTSIPSVAGYSTAAGTPAVIGMLINFEGVGGMTQLNTMQNGSATLTSGSSTISATNTLVAGQGIMFKGPAVGTGSITNGVILPPSISPNIPYYVLASGLSGTQFQLSLTKGGSPVVVDPTNIYTGTWPNCTFNAGWFVTGVSGTNVTLDVDSTAFSTFTGGGAAFFVNSTYFYDNLRLACNALASDMPLYTKYNYDDFAAEGGLFPSQYLISGAGQIWPVIQPDIYTLPGPNSEWQGIINYNH